MNYPIITHWPWRDAESSPCWHRTGGPWTGSPVRRAAATCAHRSRDGSAPHSSDWSEWCRYHRASGSAWSSPRSRWPPCLCECEYNSMRVCVRVCDDDDKINKRSPQPCDSSKTSHILLSTTMKLGWRFLLISPTPPSRKPTQVSCTEKWNDKVMSLQPAAVLAYLIANHRDQLSLHSGVGHSESAGILITRAKSKQMCTNECTVHKNTKYWKFLVLSPDLGRFGRYFSQFCCCCHMIGSWTLCCHLIEITCSVNLICFDWVANLALFDIQIYYHRASYLMDLLFVCK